MRYIDSAALMAAALVFGLSMPGRADDAGKGNPQIPGGIEVTPDDGGITIYWGSGSTSLPLPRLPGAEIANVTWTARSFMLGPWVKSVTSTAATAGTVDLGELDLGSLGKIKLGDLDLGKLDLGKVDEGSKGWARGPELPEVFVPFLEVEDIDSSPLGLKLGVADPVLRAQLGLGEHEGAPVVDVPGDSIGARFGVRTHDVIVSANGEPVASAARLQELWDATHDGQSFELVVYRAGRAMVIGGTK